MLERSWEGAEAVGTGWLRAPSLPAFHSSLKAQDAKRRAYWRPQQAVYEEGGWAGWPQLMEL